MLAAANRIEFDGPRRHRANPEVLLFGAKLTGNALG